MQDRLDKIQTYDETIDFVKMEQLQKNQEILNIISKNSKTQTNQQIVDPRTRNTSVNSIRNDSNNRRLGLNSAEIEKNVRDISSAGRLQSIMKDGILKVVGKNGISEDKPKTHFQVMRQKRQEMLLQLHYNSTRKKKRKKTSNRKEVEVEYGGKEKFNFFLRKVTNKIKII